MKPPEGAVSRPRLTAPVFFFHLQGEKFSKFFMLGEIQKSALRVKNFQKFENFSRWGNSEKVLVILFEKVENHLKTLLKSICPNVFRAKSAKIFRLRRALLWEGSFN